MKKFLDGCLVEFVVLFAIVFVIIILVFKTCADLLLDSDYDVMTTEVIDTNFHNGLADSLMYSLSNGSECICLDGEVEEDTFFRSRNEFKDYFEIQNSTRFKRQGSLLKSKNARFVRMTLFKGSVVIKRIEMSKAINDSIFRVNQIDDTYGAIYYQNFVQLYKDDKLLELIYLTKVNDNKYSFRHKLGSDSLDRTWICNGLN